MTSQEQNPALVDENSIEKHSVSAQEGKELKDAQVVEVTNADYALALASGPKLSATSPASIQLFLVLLVAFMGSMSNGFDGQVMGAVNGMRYSSLRALPQSRPLTGITVNTLIILEFRPMKGVELARQLH
ncbi:hypothetical protein PM082_005769 [Marasmius tenuissimus]|nr:hypothetical protein PM082_005769 [Marasmius tenuissimus]